MTSNPIIYFLLSGLSIEFLLKCFISIILGGFISYILIVSGQKWAQSFNNISTYAILPLVGLVITSVISKNLGLALGMVGALSVIRFRQGFGRLIRTSFDEGIFIVMDDRIISKRYGIMFSESIPVQMQVFKYLEDLSPP